MFWTFQKNCSLNGKRIRLALVSASGTPMATNLSFLYLRALRTSKIWFLGEKWFILMGRMFPNVENMIYWLLVKNVWGSNRGSNWRSQVSGLSSQVSCLRCQVSEIDAIANQIYKFVQRCYRLPDFHFLTDAIAHQICPFHNWCYR